MGSLEFFITFVFWFLFPRYSRTKLLFFFNLFFCNKFVASTTVTSNRAMAISKACVFSVDRIAKWGEKNVFASSKNRKKNNNEWRGSKFL